jgi:hypothetical protein
MMQDFRKNCKKRKQAMVAEETQRFSESLSHEESGSEGRISSNECSYGSEPQSKIQQRKRSASIDGSAV